MTLVLEIAPDLERRLEQAAAEEGITPAALAARVLDEHLGGGSGAEKLGAVPQEAGESYQSRFARALALIDELTPAIRAGSRGTFSAAEALEANREERMEELAPARWRKE